MNLKSSIVTHWRTTCPDSFAASVPPEFRSLVADARYPSEHAAMSALESILEVCISDGHVLCFSSGFYSGFARQEFADAGGEVLDLGIRMIRNGVTFDVEPIGPQSIRWLAHRADHYRTAHVECGHWRARAYAMRRRTATIQTDAGPVEASANVRTPISDWIEGNRVISGFGHEVRRDLIPFFAPVEVSK